MTLQHRRMIEAYMALPNYDAPVLFEMLTIAEG